MNPRQNHNTSAQVGWIAALNAAGIEARIVRPGDWDELILRLQP